ncbi:MAG: hypothetical protein WED15_01655 [Akkermansiaceae bacterium]
MNLPLFSDRRSASLLHRVRKDIHHLREDIGNLLQHTTSKAVPAGARDLADQAKHQLAAGSAYAASRMRKLRRHAPEADHSPALIGGAVVVGLLAFGFYALCRNECQTDDLRDALIPPDDSPGTAIS